MNIDIDSLSEDELIALNQRIVERLKFLESIHTHKEMMQFNPGEKVSFEPPGRGRQIGTLARILHEFRYKNGGKSYHLWCLNQSDKKFRRDQMLPA